MGYEHFIVASCHPAKDVLLGVNPWRCCMEWATFGDLFPAKKFSKSGPLLRLARGPIDEAQFVQTLERPAFRDCDAVLATVKDASRREDAVACGHP